MTFIRLLSGLFLLICISGSKTLPEVWSLGDEKFYKGNYLAPIVALEARAIAYMNHDEKRGTYVQRLGEFYSHVGQYIKATKTHGLSFLQIPDIGNLKASPGMTMLSARQTIVTEAKNRQIVMLNEAHHIPRHRAFTTSLLKDLYASGYRYLAMEALASFSSDFDVSELTDLAKRGYPQFGVTGHFVNEPVMGELVRQALKLGYTLIRYEEKDPECTPPNPEDWVFCLNRRDKEQAQNIYEIFKKDKQAKVLVHAGYSHIEETVSPEGWKYMAIHLKEMTGLDPLTIDQTHLTQKYYRKLDNYTGFNALLKVYSPREPVVFKQKNGQFFLTKNPHNGRSDYVVDLQVMHPPARYRGGRPLWLHKERKLFAANPDLCDNDFPCLFEARYSHETEDPVPADIVMLRGHVTQTSLALRKGKYRVDVKDKKGQLLNTYLINNK